MCSGALIAGPADAAWSAAAQTIKTLQQPQPQQQAASVSPIKASASPKRYSTNSTLSSLSPHFSPNSARAGGGNASSSNVLSLGNYNYAAAAATVVATTTATTTTTTTTTGYPPYDLHDTVILKQVR